MPFNSPTKNAGELIRADDWNALRAEVVRLDAEKVDLGGGDTIAGDLGLQGSLSVQSRLHFGSSGSAASSRFAPNNPNGLSLIPKDGPGADIYVDGGKTNDLEALVFATGSSTGSSPGQTERLVIETKSGRVGIAQRRPTALLQVSNACCDGTTWKNCSSRALKSDIQSLDDTRALEVLTELDPVTFRYTDGDGHPRAGFIAEDVPELVAAADRKTLSPMDILAVVTRVVQAQQEEIDVLKAALAATGVAAPSTA